MRKSIVGLIITALVLGALWPTGVGAAKQQVAKTSQSVSIADTSRDKLNRFIQDNIKRLSDEEGFAAWTKVTWDVYPLGPGTHGWAVLLSHKQQEIGYLIVSSTPSGELVLTEYGTGESPLFSHQTLYTSLLTQQWIPQTLTFTQLFKGVGPKVERIYIDALQAVWRLTLEDGAIFYADASNGDILPLLAAMLQGKPELQPVQPLTLELAKPVSLLLQAFDPYDRLPWVKKKPMLLPQFSDLQALLENKAKITYAGKIYSGQMLIPLAVIGYHCIPGQSSYVAVTDGIEQERVRYIQYDVLARSGGFYQ